MGLAVLVAVLIGAGFVIYILAIGAHKTHARNLYNDAHLALKDDRVEQAVQLMSQAYAAWPEEYILQEIKKLTLD